MQFRLELQPEAEYTLANLESTDPKKYRKVLKTLALLQTNLRHPGLQTHKYDDLSGPNSEEVFEAYVENKTPAAFRVFWYYGPGSRSDNNFSNYSSSLDQATFRSNA